MPSAQSCRKLLMTPIVKNVSTKKIPRKALASNIAALTCAATAGEAASAMTRMIRNVRT